MSNPYDALIADLQALETPLDPGVVAALATFWKNKEINQRHVLRLVLLETLWEWVGKSHAAFPEHDHHCPVQSPLATEGCTCGFTAAQEAMKQLDILDRQ